MEVQDTPYAWPICFIRYAAYAIQLLGDSYQFHTPLVCTIVATDRRLGFP